MTDLHLSDDRLIDICVSSPPTPAEQAHLQDCGACGRRRVSIVEILTELDDAAAIEADAAFPPDRLARQESRILNRIEQDGRPARVITFPAYQPPTTTLMRSRPHVRWAAAAAAAAFVVGLLAGHLAHDLPLGEVPPPRAAVAVDADPAPLRAVPTTFSEDEFLGQVELAAARNGPAALRYIDAATPRAWEVR